MEYKPITLPQYWPITPRQDFDQAVVQPNHVLLFSQDGQSITAKLSDSSFVRIGECSSTSDATATAADILQGKTAYISGGIATGTIPTVSASIVNGAVVVPSGYISDSQSFQLQGAQVTLGYVSGGLFYALGFSGTSSYEAGISAGLSTYGWNLPFSGQYSIEIVSGGDIISRANSMYSMTLNSGYSMNVYSGGTANSTTVNSGGQMYVYSGGTALAVTSMIGANITVDSGGYIQYVTDSDSSSSQSQPMINSQGILLFAGNSLISSANTMQNKYVSGQGRMQIYSSGTATSTVIYQIVSSGGQLVYDGGVANNNQIDNNGLVSVLNGGVINSAEMTGNGAVYIIGGSAVAPVISSGFMDVTAYGKVSSAVVKTSGQLIIHGTASANNTTVINSGFLVAGGTVSNTTVSGYMRVENGYAQSTHVTQDGDMFVYTGVVSSTIIDGGGKVTGGIGQPIFNDVTVSNWGQLQLSSGTTATNISANTAAKLYLTVASNTLAAGTLAGSPFALSSSMTSLDIVSGMYITMGSGGVIDSVTIGGGGYLNASSGTVSSATVNSGGRLYGKYTTYTIGSSLNPIHVTQNGGFFAVQSLTLGAIIPNTINGLTLQDASMTVHSNTVASNIVISAGGKLLVYSSGLAEDIRMGVPQIGMQVQAQVLSGGVMSAVIVSSGARLTVWSGGTALSVTCQQGGIVISVAGAVVS